MSWESKVALKSARLTGFSPRIELLENREVLSGYQTAAAPYLVPVAPSVAITPLLTVGDTVADNYTANGVGTDYRMVGIPDGMGAFDNGDGTFTVLMNHELGNADGVVRDHGSKGAFVSRWVIDKTTLEILEGDDLIKQVYLWNTTTNSYEAATSAFARLCSADLAAPTAYFNGTTGKGTTARILLNGEEVSNGRAFAHVATGPNAGTSWELPWAGKYAWENHVASPYAQDKTIVVGLDDSNRNFSSEGDTEPSEVYVWVGNKQSTGTEIEKAGLRYGILHGLRVGTPGSYDANEGTVTSGERFELVALSDQTNNTTFAPLEAESIANTITQFRRVEDGAFDPTNPNVFYFVTTDRFGGSTRLWKLTFDDIRNPEAGGVIEIAVDGALPEVPAEMFDNITVNWNGDVLLQEDPGNQAYLAKIWQYDASTGDLIEVSQHNPALFGAPGIDLYPDIPGVQSTQDEESSGIIDLSHILGKGYYLADVQAHYRFTVTTDPTNELVQGGQLLVINTNAASAVLEAEVLTVQGTINDDVLSVVRHGHAITVRRGFDVLGRFDARDVETIRIDAGAGSDVVVVSHLVHADALILGGLGNDVLLGGGRRNFLIGGAGSDLLIGGCGSDVLIGGEVADSAAVDAAFADWTDSGSYRRRAAAVETALSGKIVDDATDWLVGRSNLDLFFASSGDWTDLIWPEHRV